MSIYKVHVATEGDTTTYKTNGTTLAEIRNERGEFTIYQDGKTMGHCCELANARTFAEKLVSDLMASVGVTSKFINE